MSAASYLMSQFVKSRTYSLHDSHHKRKTIESQVKNKTKDDRNAAHFEATKGYRRLSVLVRMAGERISHRLAHLFVAATVFFVASGWRILLRSHLTENAVDTHSGASSLAN